MPVIYYTSDDLLMRRVAIAQWICAQSHKVVANFKYGELIDPIEFMRYQYVVACLEAIECYIPITSEAEDGETNCLTELQLNNIFENVEEIMDRSFLAPGTSYNPNEFVIAPNADLKLNTGFNITLNYVPTAADLLNQPHLGTGNVQLSAPQIV